MRESAIHQIRVCGSHVVACREETISLVSPNVFGRKTIREKNFLTKFSSESEDVGQHAERERFGSEYPVTQLLPSPRCERTSALGKTARPIRRLDATHSN